MRVERGRLGAVFDANFAFLREIAVDGEELFRGVGFVARDADWGTPALAARGFAQDRAGALVVEAQGELDAPSGDLAWRIRWEITASSLEAQARWSSRAGFVTNRTGFVVLHSLSAARGRPVQIRHCDGVTELSAFPELVSPDQPFFDIAAMSYESAAGARVDIRFQGEAFETEDQRNWTDASYKTYCRPLRLPHPYRIAPGVEERQSVRLEWRPAKRATARRDADAPQVEAPSPAPLLGASLGPEPPAPGVAEAIRQLAFDFTALELEPAIPGFEAELSAGLEAARGVVRLDFRPAPREARLAAARRAAALLGDRACLGLTLWGADDDEIEAARGFAGHTPIGAGSAAFFAELNRMRPLPARADYLAFPATPTVHGDSDDTIGETTEPWEDLIATYETLAGGRALHLGPLTLGIRFNPNATSAEGRRGAAPDPRQSHAIAAAWALAALAGAHGPATRAVSVFQPHGPKGLVSETGALTSAARALSWLRAARGKSLRKVRWPQAPRARGLLLEDARTLWVSHAKAGVATLPLPPGSWSVKDFVADEPPRVEARRLTVQDFGAVQLRG